MATRDRSHDEDDDDSPKLTKRQWRALKAASDALIEDYELALSADGDPLESALIGFFLPAQMADRYSPAFCRRFFEAFRDLSKRVLSRKPFQLRSVAEEMAFRALIDVAKDDETITDKDADALDFFSDCLNQDYDFEMLFDPRMDGFDTAPHAALMNYANLRFEQWFDPFGNVE